MTTHGATYVLLGVPLNCPVVVENETPAGRSPVSSVASRSTTGSASPVLVTVGEDEMGLPETTDRFPVEESEPGIAEYSNEPASHVDPDRETPRWSAARHEPDPTALTAELPAPIEYVGVSPPHGARMPSSNDAEETVVSPPAMHDDSVETLSTGVLPLRLHAEFARVTAGV